MMTGKNEFIFIFIRPSNASSLFGGTVPSLGRDGHEG